MKNFKKLIFITAVGLTGILFFNSCEKTEQMPPVDGSDFPGTYKLTSYKINDEDPENPGAYISASADLNGDMSTSSDLTLESSCYGNSYIRFNSNHTYSRLYSYDDAGTCVTAVREAGVWNREGDIITISASNTNGNPDTGLSMMQYTMEFNYSSGSGTISGSRENVDNFTGNTFGVGRVDFIYAKVAE